MSNEPDDDQNEFEEEEFRLWGGPVLAAIKYVVLSIFVTCLSGFLSVIASVLTIQYLTGGRGQPGTVLQLLPVLFFLLALVFSFWFCWDQLYYRVVVKRNGVLLGHDLIGRFLEYEEITFLSGEPRKELNSEHPQLVLEAGRRRYIFRMKKRQVADCFYKLRPLCVRAATVSPGGEERLPVDADARPQGYTRLLKHRLKAVLVAWAVGILATGYGGCVVIGALFMNGKVNFAMWLLPAGLAGMVYAVRETKRFMSLLRDTRGTPSEEA